MRGQKMKIKILIPVYNDWSSVFKLLENINLIVENLKHEFSILIVNDASIENKEERTLSLPNLKSIKIINMKENKGHARCNAAGLKYIYDNENFDYIIPMDGDGEDRPEEIKEFVNKIAESKDVPIVGERIKRSEGLFFEICYYLHKILTITFTGKSIRFGNFTCLPKSIVYKLINEPATWSSFSGSLTKISNEKIGIPSVRGKRYFGPSKMSFLNLLKHSLAIIAVFKHSFFIRLILFVVIYFFLLLGNISLVTIFPIFLAFIFLISVFLISKRENLEEFNNSHTNIRDIITFK